MICMYVMNHLYFSFYVSTMIYIFLGLTHYFTRVKGGTSLRIYLNKYNYANASIKSTCLTSLKAIGLEMNPI